MRIISVNVGLPHKVPYRGRSISTGIYKEPVEGRIKVHRLNLAGDHQADLSVHGGIEKAVYAYPSEHYEFWKGELPEMDLPWGMFGENLTTEGLLEDKVNIGDKLKIGTALFTVTQPRMPCYKLGIKFGRNDIIKRFLRSGRTGYYFSVFEEGEVAAGDTIELVNRDNNKIIVTDITSLYVNEKSNLELLKRVIQVEALPHGWRDHFRHQIDKLD